MASQFNPTTAVDYGQFVIAAYTMYENDPTNLNPSKSCNFPSGYDLVATVQMSDFFGAEEERKFYGFIAVSTSGPTTWVLAIRGTAALIEWWDDFHWGFVPFAPVANGGQVAEGFLCIYQTLGVLEPGQSAAESKPSRSFAADVAGVVQRAIGIAVASAVQAWATGHSLGAALITLFVLDAAKNASLVPNVFTFASPRVGDSAFVNSYNGVYSGADVTQTSWRIDNSMDIVPDFPPDISGYAHVNTEYLIDSSALVRWTIPCAHALNSYLHVLDQSVIKLDPACQPLFAL
jgi:hypothetical protein